MKKQITTALMAFAAALAFTQVYPRTPRKYDFELSDMARRLTPVIGFNRNMHDIGSLWGFCGYLE